VRCGPGGEVKVEEGPPERVTFSVKMVCKTVRGWTLGWSLPIYNFDEDTPPPPLGGCDRLEETLGKSVVFIKMKNLFANTNNIRKLTE